MESGSRPARADCGCFVLHLIHRRRSSGHRALERGRLPQHGSGAVVSPRRRARNHVAHGQFLFGIPGEPVGLASFRRLFSRREREHLHGGRRRDVAAQAGGRAVGDGSQSSTSGTGRPAGPAARASAGAARRAASAAPSASITSKTRIGCFRGFKKISTAWRPGARTSPFTARRPTSRLWYCLHTI